MLKKCINLMTKTNIISKILKRPFSNTLSEREKAVEKNYILR